MFDFVHICYFQKSRETCVRLPCEVSCNLCRWRCYDRRITFYCCSIPEREMLNFLILFFMILNAADCKVQCSATGYEFTAHSDFVLKYNVYNL